MIVRRFVIVALVASMFTLVVGIQASSSQAASAGTKAGCKLVGKKKKGKSFLFRTTLAVVRGRVSFCYDGNQVLRPQTWCEVVFHDTNTVENRGCDAQGGYYQWNGNPNGAYDALFSFKFGNCVLKVGCFSSSTYNMHIRVHADGTWN